jgi:hypothetical protein
LPSLPLIRAPSRLAAAVGHVSLQVGLLESLASPVRQRGHPVRRQAEDRRHLGRRLALDLGVPQHRLPSLRQRAERPRDQGLLELGEDGVAERLREIDVLGRLLAELQLGRVVGGVPKRGEQVRRGGMTPLAEKTRDVASRRPCSPVSGA